MTDERKYLDQELISLRSQIVGMNMGGGGISGGNVNNSARHYQGQHNQVPSFGGGGPSSNQINKSSSSQKFGGEFGDFMPSESLCF